MWVYDSCAIIEAIYNTKPLAGHVLVIGGTIEREYSMATDVTQLTGLD